MEWVLAALYRLSLIYELPLLVKADPRSPYLLPFLRERFKLAIVRLNHHRLNEIFPRAMDGSCRQLSDAWNDLGVSSLVCPMIGGRSSCVYHRAINQGKRLYDTLTVVDKEAIDALADKLRRLMTGEEPTETERVE